MIIITWGEGGGENKVKKCRRKEKRKKALRRKSFIYYNNLRRVICKNPFRKVELSKIRVGLIIINK